MEKICYSISKDDSVVITVSESEYRVYIVKGKVVGNNFDPSDHIGWVANNASIKDFIEAVSIIEDYYVCEDGGSYYMEPKKMHE